MSRFTINRILAYARTTIDHWRNVEVAPSETGARAATRDNAATRVDAAYAINLTSFTGVFSPISKSYINFSECQNAPIAQLSFAAHTYGLYRPLAGLTCPDQATDSTLALLRARTTARRGTRPAVCGVPSACCACIRTSSRPRR